MIIEGEASNGVASAPVTSIWRFKPDDPWVTKVDFVEDEVTWDISLDLLREALTSPGLRGSGDLLIEVSGIHVVLYLRNGFSTATVKLPVDEVQEFLDQIDDRDSDETVARELERFLETLEVD
ncbi:SsgA family sporulation/cell division regulator [Streptomyces sp. NPDC006355]|uniref:SsgA family sporulation/cell division regulator n=1 Tax=Streptomyces sp. NPDC006355 TaxID=3156758 RepID=UPI0033A16D38